MKKSKALMILTIVMIMAVGSIAITTEVEARRNSYSIRTSWFSIGHGAVLDLYTDSAMAGRGDPIITIGTSRGLVWHNAPVTLRIENLTSDEEVREVSACAVVTN